MKIKRFFAPDMRTAIRQVSEEQGPDAVILSSRKVEGGIEIVSAMDYDQSLIEGGLSSRDEPRKSSRATAPQYAEPDSAPATPPRPLRVRELGLRSPERPAAQRLPQAVRSGSHGMQHRRHSRTVVPSNEGI